MAVAINTSFFALDFIPGMQKYIDQATGGRRRLQIHRVSVHATVPFRDSDLWRQSHALFLGPTPHDDLLPKQEALDWQPDPDDDLGDLDVSHHLRQQAATVPLLASLNPQSDHGEAATTLTGSALSASIDAATQGRLLSSFHRYSFRESSVALSKSNSGYTAFSRPSSFTALSPSDLWIIDPFDIWILSHRYYSLYDLPDSIVWAGHPRDTKLVFWQLQLDVVDLSSRRTLPTSRPGKRRRTAFNPFLQVAHSSLVEDTSRGNPQVPHARTFNGVRYRPDRRTWVAEMKPPRHVKKQDFGNFKSEGEAARAVDAAFHHYGRSELLNFPETSLQFLSKRPMAPPELDEKAKVRFVREEAKLLLKAIATSSPLHSTPRSSLQLLEPSASPRRCASSQFRSFSEISWPLSCSGPEEVDDVVSQFLPGMLVDSNCDIFTTGGQTNLEIPSPVQISEQGWDCFEDSSPLAAPPNVVNLSAYEIRSVWPCSLIRSPPALPSWRSPSPSDFQTEIANALLEQQSTDDDIFSE